MRAGTSPLKHRRVVPSGGKWLADVQFCAVLLHCLLCADCITHALLKLCEILMRLSMRKEVCTLSQLHAHRLWLLDCCEVFARLRDWDAAVWVCSVGRRVLWGAAVASWLLMNSLDALGLPLFKSCSTPQPSLVGVVL